MHPVHVSYSNLEINPESGEFTLTLKFFTDDLRLLFIHLYEYDMVLEPDKELSPGQVEMISRYLSDAFIIKNTDNQYFTYSYQQKEQNDESLWLHFKGTLASRNPSEITISNSLLLDLYLDQTNLLIIKWGEFEKGYRCDYQVRNIVVERKI
jgi:hypothetical protein